MSQICISQIFIRQIFIRQMGHLSAKVSYAKVVYAKWDIYPPNGTFIRQMGHLYAKFIRQYGACHQRVYLRVRIARLATFKGIHYTRAVFWTQVLCHALTFIRQMGHLYAKWDIYTPNIYTPNLYTPNGTFIRQTFIRQIFISQIFIRQIFISQMRCLYAKLEFYTPSENIYPPISGVAGVRTTERVGQALHSQHAGRRANIIS